MAPLLWREMKGIRRCLWSLAEKLLGQASTHPHVPKRVGNFVNSLDCDQSVKFAAEKLRRSLEVVTNPLLCFAMTPRFLGPKNFGYWTVEIREHILSATEVDGQLPVSIEKYPP